MHSLNAFVADPRRVLLGAIAAPAVASLAAELPIFSFADFWAFFFLGLMSVITLYLPIVLWNLCHTRRPLWTCIWVGAVSAPGIIG